MIDDGVPIERANNPFTRSARGGRVLSALQQPFFQLYAPAGFTVLTTTGRRTGRPRRRCVRAALDGDKAYLVMLGPVLLGVPADRATSAWMRNIRADPTVRMRIRNGTVGGVAREITDPDELATARHVYTSTVNRFDSAEFRFHIADRPTPEKIRRLHRHWFDHGVPVVVELER